MSFLSMAMIWFVLPEALPMEKRSTAPVGARGPQLATLWKALFGPLGFLFLLAFLVNFALANFEGIFGLFADKTYHYSPTNVGSVMMVVGIISAAVQMLLTGPATSKLGDAMVIKLSLIASGIGFVFMVLSPNNFLVPITVGFFVFANAMLRPAISSITSKKALEGQGMAMGLNNSFQSLGRVVGPLWAGTLFDVHNTLPYLSGAVIMVAAFGFSLYAIRNGPDMLAQQYGQLMGLIDEVTALAG